jgi:hypothetical protein
MNTSADDVTASPVGLDASRAYLPRKETRKQQGERKRNGSAATRAGSYQPPPLVRKSFR